MSTLKFDPATYGIILEAKIKKDFAEISHLILDTGSTYVMIPWKLAVATHLSIQPFLSTLGVGVDLGCHPRSEFLELVPIFIIILDLENLLNIK